MEGKINDEIKVKIHTYMKSDRAMKEKDKNKEPNQSVICPEYLQLLVPLQICVLLYLMMFGSESCPESFFISLSALGSDSELWL